MHDAWMIFIGEPSDDPKPGFPYCGLSETRELASLVAVLQDGSVIFGCNRPIRTGC
jgi:hypothetical protein